MAEALSYSLETGASVADHPFTPGFMPYSEEIEAANQKGALLVMVTYDGVLPTMSRFPIW